MYSKPHMTGKSHGEQCRCPTGVLRQTRHHTRQAVLGLRATAVTEDLRDVPPPAIRFQIHPLVSGEEGMCATSRDWVWEKPGVEHAGSALTGRVAHTCPSKAKSAGHNVPAACNQWLPSPSPSFHETGAHSLPFPSLQVYHLAGKRILTYRFSSLPLGYHLLKTGLVSGLLASQLEVS